MVKNRWFIIFLLLALCMVQVSFKDKGSDYYEQVTPIVKSMQDSNYLKNDFYVQENQGFNVRMFFSMFVRGVDMIFNNLDYSYIFVYVFIYFMLSYTIYLVMFHITKDNVFSLLAVVFLHSVTYIQLGALNLFGVRPNTLGYALIFFSLYHFLQRNYKNGFFILGAVVPYQIILGLLTYCTFIFCIIYEDVLKLNVKKAIVKIIKSLTFFIIAFPVLFMFLKTSIKTSLPQYSSQFGYIFSHFMHDSHSAPFTWSFMKYFVFFLFVVVVYYASKKIDHSEYINRYGKPCALCLGMFMTIGLIFVEFIPIGVVAKAQMFRCLVLFTTFGYLIIFRYVYEQIKFFDIKTITFLYTLILCSFFFSTTVPIGLLLILLNIKQIKSVYKIMSWVSNQHWLYFLQWLLFGIGITVLFVVMNNMFNDVFQIYRVLFNILFFICVMFTINKSYKQLMIYGLCAVLIFTNTYNYNACTEIEDVTNFIKHETNENAILLIPPYELRFRLCADRAVVVDGQPLYTDTSAWEWKQRMEDVIGVSILGIINNDVDKLYHQNSPEQMYNSIIKYNASYIVLNKKYVGDYNNDTFYDDNDYIVYEVRK